MSWRKKFTNKNNNKNVVNLLQYHKIITSLIIVLLLRSTTKIVASASQSEQQQQSLEGTRSNIASAADADNSFGSAENSNVFNKSLVISNNKSDDMPRTATTTATRMTAKGLQKLFGHEGGLSVGSSDDRKMDATVINSVARNSGGGQRQQEQQLTRKQEQLSLPKLTRASVVKQFEIKQQQVYNEVKLTTLSHPTVGYNKLVATTNMMSWQNKSEYNNIIGKQHRGKQKEEPLSLLKTDKQPQRLDEQQNDESFEEFVITTRRPTEQERKERSKARILTPGIEVEKKNEKKIDNKNDAYSKVVAGGVKEDIKKEETTPTRPTMQTKIAEDSMTVNANSRTAHANVDANLQDVVARIEANSDVADGAKLMEVNEVTNKSDKQMLHIFMSTTTRSRSETMPKAVGTENQQAVTRREQKNVNKNESFAEVNKVEAKEHEISKPIMIANNMTTPDNYRTGNARRTENKNPQKIARPTQLRRQQRNQSDSTEKETLPKPVKSWLQAEEVGQWKYAENKELTRGNKKTARKSVTQQQSSLENHKRALKVDEEAKKVLQGFSEPLEGNNKTPKVTHRLMPTKQDEQHSESQQGKPQQSISNSQLSQQSRSDLKSTMEAKRTKQEFEELELVKEHKPQQQSKHAAGQGSSSVELEAQYIPEQLLAKKDNDDETHAIVSLNGTGKGEPVSEHQIELMRAMNNQTKLASKQKGATKLKSEKDFQEKKEQLGIRQAKEADAEEATTKTQPAASSATRNDEQVKLESNQKITYNAKVNKTLSTTKKKSKLASIEQTEKEANGGKLSQQSKSDKTTSAETRNDETRQTTSDEETKSESIKVKLPEKQQSALKYANKNLRSDKVIAGKVGKDDGIAEVSNELDFSMKSQRLPKIEEEAREHGSSSAERQQEEQSRVNKSKEMQALNEFVTSTISNLADNTENNNNNNNYATNERNKILINVSEGNGLENSLSIAEMDAEKFMWKANSNAKITAVSSKNETTTTMLTAKKKAVQRKANQQKLSAAHSEVTTSENTTWKNIEEARNLEKVRVLDRDAKDSGTENATYKARAALNTNAAEHSAQIGVMDQLEPINRAKNNWEHASLISLPPLANGERAESETMDDWQQQQELATLNIRRPDMRTGEALKLNDTLLPSYNKVSAEEEDEGGLLMDPYTTQKVNLDSAEIAEKQLNGNTTKTKLNGSARLVHENVNKTVDDSTQKQSLHDDETKAKNFTIGKADEKNTSTPPPALHVFPAADNERENYTENPFQANITTARNSVLVKMLTTIAPTVTAKIFEDAAQPPTTEIAIATDESSPANFSSSTTSTNKEHEMVEQQMDNTATKNANNNQTNNIKAAAEGNDNEGVTEATMRITASSTTPSKARVTETTTAATTALVPTIMNARIQSHTNATKQATIQTTTTAPSKRKESSYFVLPNFVELTSVATTIPQTYAITTQEYTLHSAAAASTFLYTTTATTTTTTTTPSGASWPVKHASVMEGDVILGGLMMVHSREDSITCGPIMPQGGIQALEAMLYTLDQVNKQQLLPNITLGAHILDDCDKDTYGLEMAVDFIKGESLNNTKTE